MYRFVSSVLCNVLPFGVHVHERDAFTANVIVNTAHNMTEKLFAGTVML